MEALIITHSKIKRILLICFASILVLAVKSSWAGEIMLISSCKVYIPQVFNDFCSPLKKSNNTYSFPETFGCKYMPFVVLTNWPTAAFIMGEKRKRQVICHPIIEPTRKYEMDCKCKVMD